MERAYAHVRGRLLDGTYPGGTLLSEGAVAQDLAISRTPVREAFLQLQAEGFLRLYPKRGALVVPITLTEGRETMEASLLLEQFALDCVAARGTEAVRQLGKVLAADTGTLEVEAGRDFHTHLVTAAGNGVISEMYDRLRLRQLRLVAASMTTPRHAAENDDEHAAIVDALSLGDAPRARRLLQQHTAAILRRLGLATYDDGSPGRP
ncbi:GntR family transcriptional regulator [Nocardia sp. JMUB6875]